MINSKINGLLFYFGFVFLIFFNKAVIHSALAIDVPAYDGPVTDHAHLLSLREKQNLTQALIQFKDQHGPRLQVITINSLEGEPIENFSIKVADQWKVGDAKKDNGVLLVIAIADRALRIEVGQGLEGDLPDIICGRIIEGMKPYFQQQNFLGGITFALNQMAEKLGGKLNLNYQAPPAKSRHRRNSSFFPTIIIFIIFFIISIFRRGRGSLLTGGGYHSSGGGFGGGGFGGGSSGGFGGGGFSGGGGGFSGGGSSGRW